MTPVVTYQLDDGTDVRFEIEPTNDWVQVSSDEVLAGVSCLS
jgi:hypothetical protein